MTQNYDSYLIDKATINSVRAFRNRICKFKSRIVGDLLDFWCPSSFVSALLEYLERLVRIVWNLGWNYGKQ